MSKRFQLTQPSYLAHDPRPQEARRAKGGGAWRAGQKGNATKEI